MLRGSCLCGGVRFEVAGSHSAIGFCHCSLCRKRSGVHAGAEVLVDFGSVRWISGEDLVARWERPSGYGTAFCRVCGCPAPDHDRRRTVYTLPVGLFDDDPDLSVGDHCYTSSRAPWDVLPDDGAPRFEGEGPPRPRDRGP